MADRTQVTRRVVTGALVVAAAIAATFVPVGRAQAQEPPRPTDPNGVLAAKDGSTPLSGRLRVLRDRSGQRLGEGSQNRAVGLPTEGPGRLLRGEGGTLLVNVRLTRPDPQTFAALARAGASVVARADAEHLATLAVLPADLAALATVPGVEWVEELLAPSVGSDEDRPSVGGAADPGPATRGLCSDREISEGDTQLRADVARTNNGVDGTGVTVGILSDSYNRTNGAAADVADGELPGPGNPCGRTTPVVVQSEYVERPSQPGIDEGRAMAQLVHDLAPGSSLRVASAFNGYLDFADQIRLLAAGGADVIVDDIAYFEEPIYQDGPIAKAVEDVSAQGIPYFSAAGNDNIIIGGRNVASYEAPAYRSMSCPAVITNSGNPSSPYPYTCHDFIPSTTSTPSTDAHNDYRVAAGGQLFVKLGWNEPANGIVTDLDLYLIDAVTGQLVAGSIADNIDDTEQAYELLSYDNDTGNARTFRLVVARYGAGVTTTPRFKTIVLQGDAVTSVQYNQSNATDVVGPATYGHSATQSGAGIAAIQYDTLTAPQEYSSRGPANACFGPVVGTSPAAPLPGGCQRRDLHVTATDGARNSFFIGADLGGYYRFYGTSAAAPHAAAVAALQRQARPCATPAQILAAQKASARPISGLGRGTVGAGLLTATTSITNLAACVGPPSAPANVYAEPRNGGASVSWIAPAANGSAITGYTITPYIGAAAQAPQVFAGTATTRTVTGLTNGTTYTFRVTATNGLGTSALSAPSNAVTPSVPPAGTVYVPITPCRVLDTRNATPGRLAANAQRNYRIAGTGIPNQGGASSCIPAGAAAAEASVTAVSPGGNGYFRAWPVGAPAPNATFLNYASGQATTNTGTLALAPATSPPGPDLTVRNVGSSADYVIDVQGYFIDPAAAPAGTGAIYVPITPCRVLDTRSGGGGRLTAGQQRTYQVAGPGLAGQGAAASCIPDGVAAVEASVTAVGPAGNGYFRAWPSDAAAPNATFLNYVSNRAITNTGALKLAATGSLDLRVANFGGSADYVVDVQGYYVLPGAVPTGVTGSRYVPITPCRVLDTRNVANGRFGNGRQVDERMAGGPIVGQGAQLGCVPDGASAVEASVTTVSPAGNGYFRAWPSDADQPNATFLNFSGQAITNTGALALAAAGTKDLTVRNVGASSDYVIDLQGYFVPAP